MAADKYILATAELVEATGVAISGSTMAAGRPLSNLLDPYPHKTARSSSLSTVYFELDLTAAKSVYGLWLGYTNFRPGVTQWRVRAATSQANLTAAPDYDSTTVYALAASGYDSSTYASDWPNGTHAFLHAGGSSWSERFNRRWVRVDLTDAAHPDGYFQMGRLLVVGAGWSPAIGPPYGSTPPGEVLRPDWERGPSGELFPNPTFDPSSEEWEFKFLTRAEAKALRRLVRNRGAHGEVLSMWLDGTASAEEGVTHGYIAEFDPPVARGVGSGVSRWQASVRVESAAAMAA